MRVAEGQRLRDRQLKQQTEFKDREIQGSLDRMNQLKGEHYQQKALEKHLRMQVVKGTADVIKKQQYMKIKEKVILKEKHIEEAKQ